MAVEPAVEPSVGAPPGSPQRSSPRKTKRVPGVVRYSILLWPTQRRVHHTSFTPAIMSDSSNLSRVYQDKEIGHILKRATELANQQCPPCEPTRRPRRTPGRID